MCVGAYLCARACYHGPRNICATLAAQAHESGECAKTNTKPERPSRGSRRRMPLGVAETKTFYNIGFMARTHQRGIPRSGAPATRTCAVETRIIIDIHQADTNQMLHTTTRLVMVRWLTGRQHGAPGGGESKNGGKSRSNESED